MFSCILPILTRLMFNDVRMHTYIYKTAKKSKNYEKSKKIVLVQQVYKM